MKRFLFIVFILQYSVSIYSQTDSITEQNYYLDEISISSKKDIKLKYKNGKYEVSLRNTSFDKLTNVWEGLKIIPMLSVVDNNGISVNSKSAIIQVNGIRLRLNNNDVEDYLKSLDPSSIEKIEIISNPDASFDSGIESVINIVIKKNKENYRIGLVSNQSFRSRYSNSTNANLAYNLNKISIFNSYSYGYYLRDYDANIKQGVSEQNIINFSNKILDKKLRNKLFNIFNISLNPKNQISISQNYIFSNDNVNAKIQNENIVFKEVLTRNKINKIQYAETWKYSFEDNYIKLGGYQIFNNSNTDIFSDLSSTNTSQSIENSTPIYVGFVDLFSKNNLGASSFGAKYTNIKVKSINELENENNFTIAPFKYSEQIIAFYINHVFDIDDNKSFSFGLRSESTILNASYEDVGNQPFDRRNKYTNLLYNISYNWKNKNDWFNTLSFKTTLERPNYNYLNPFKLINSGTTFSEGDTNINPSKSYFLNYELFKNPIFIYFRAGIINDFISSFFRVDDSSIIETYENFKEVKFSSLGLQYNDSFFNKNLNSKVSLSITYFNINEPSLKLTPTTPQLNFTTSNIINFGKGYNANLRYTISPEYKDGLIKHYTYHDFSIILSKKINRSMSIIIYAYDIFKNKYSWYKTTLEDLSYRIKQYNDTQTLGLSLRWALKGKKYKKSNTNELNDDSIDRL